MGNKKEDPLRFLYRTQLEVKDTPTNSSFVKKVAYAVLGLIGFVSSVGSVLSPIVNTYHFLNDKLAGHDDSISAVAGLGILSGLIALPRMRTVFEKTIRGAIHFADWDPHYDLELQLNPKSTGLSRVLGILMAYFSYAVLKEAALENFKGAYQQPMAEIGGYSIAFSHLVFSFQLFSLILTRFKVHSLYGVQAAIEAVSKWTLEDFENFIKKLSKEDLDLLQLRSPDVLDHKKESEVNTPTPTQQSNLDNKPDRLQTSEKNQEIVLPIAEEKGQISVTKNESPKEERWAHRLCSWLCVKKVERVADENHKPYVKRSH